jgi:hypothetical protein
MDNKSDITFVPRDHALVFGMFEDLVGFEQEGGDGIRRAVVIAGLFFVHIFFRTNIIE